MVIGRRLIAMIRVGKLFDLCARNSLMEAFSALMPWCSPARSLS
jgi:hypothetical protein